MIILFYRVTKFRVDISGSSRLLGRLGPPIMVTCGARRPTPLTHEAHEVATVHLTT